MAHNDPFFVQIGHKKIIFKRFIQHFSRTTELHATQVIHINWNPNIYNYKSVEKKKSGCGLWGKIWANFVQCCEKTKKNGHFNGFFLIFCMRYTFTNMKEIPEWKLKPKLAS